MDLVSIALTLISTVNQIIEIKDTLEDNYARLKSLLGDAISLRSHFLCACVVSVC